jgi:hypothetical protein
MNAIRRILLAVLLLSSTAATGSPQGQPGAAGAGGATGRDGGGPSEGPAPSRRPPRTPPPEAVAACSGKSVGVACAFQHKERTETGKCFTPDAAQAVACKPDRPPREDDAGNAR